VVDGWRRAQHEPVVAFEVHLLAAPDEPAVVHIVDVRAEHGVHMILLVGHDIETVLRSSSGRAEARPGVAQSKRDAAGAFLEVDGATSALLGWAPEHLVGRSTVELVHPDDAQHAIDHWMAMR